MLLREMQGGVQTAQRTKIRIGPVRDAGKTSLLSAAHNHVIGLQRKRSSNMVNQSLTTKPGMRLVAAEPARFASGKDGTKNSRMRVQPNFSVGLPSAL